jgi:DNA-binding MarR family transcriptional regulator
MSTLASKADGAQERPAIDIGEVLGCTCLRLRSITRGVTQLYDHLLAPAGITIGQFGILARLYGAGLRGQTALSIGMLADQHSMDPTTLTRNLKPLITAGLVQDGRDESDRRVRTVALTATGRTRLTEAMPLWRDAQHRIETALGTETVLVLNGLLDLSSVKLRM